MSPRDFPLWFILCSLFMFGAVFGSFLNVCIYRFPKHERLWDQLSGIWGRSYCPRCKTEILARDNIPIFGWLMLGGKCRKCALKISPRYPLIELLNGLLWVVVYWFQLPNGLETTWMEQCVTEPDLGPQIVNHAGAWRAEVWMHLRYVFHMVLIQSLLVATFIDFDLQIIPDGSTVPAMVFAVLASTICGQLFLVPVWFDDPSNRNMFLELSPDWLDWMFFDFPPKKVGQFAAAHPHVHGFLVSIVGLLVGGGSIWAVRIIGFRVLRQEAMGFGDVILMACIGSFLGWQPVIVVFFLAAMCAMVSVIVGSIFRRKREIPYGPYISAGALLLILFWKQIWLEWRVKAYFDLGVGIIFAGIAMGAMLFLSLSMLQLVKRMLGISMYYEEQHGEWTSADTLTYLDGENVDPNQGQWPREDGWEGTAASRGQRQEQIWRNGR